MVLGNILLFEREDQNRLVLETHLRGPGLMPIRRPLCHHKIGGAVQNLPFFAAALDSGTLDRALKVRNEQYRDPRKHGGKSRRKCRNRLLQIFFDYFFAHRQRSAEIAKGIAQRDHLAAKTLGKLTHAYPRQAGLSRNGGIWLSLARHLSFRTRF